MKRTLLFIHGRRPKLRRPFPESSVKENSCWHGKYKLIHNNSYFSPLPRRLFFFFFKEHPCIKPFDQISQCSTYANKSLFSFSLSKQARVFLTQHTARTPLVPTVPCPLTRYGNLVQSVHLQRWNQTPCPVSMFCYGAGVHTTVRSSPLWPRKKVETGCHLLSDPGRRLRLAAIQPSCLKSSSVCLWLLQTVPSQLAGNSSAGLMTTSSLPIYLFPT